MACLVAWLRLSGAFAAALSVANAASVSPLDTWLGQLRSRDPSVRLSAAYHIEMSAANSEAAVQTLLVASRDPDPFVRRHVAAVLGDLPGHTAQATPTLCRMVLDKDEDVRAQAAVALSKRGEDAFPALITMLQDTRDISKDIAIGKDEQTGATPSDYAAVALTHEINPIFPALANAYLIVRAQFARSGKGSDAHPFDLERAQRKGEYLDVHQRSVTRSFSPVYLRDLIEYIMARRPPELETAALGSYLTQVSAKDTDLAMLMAQVVNTSATDAVSLLSAMYRKYTSDAVRGFVLGKLVKAADFPDSDSDQEDRKQPRLTVAQSQTLDLLAEALQDPNPKIRQSAAKAAHAIGRPGIVLYDGLLACIGDAAPNVREACIGAIGAVLESPCAKEAVARTLVHVLDSDREATVRSTAAAALGELKFAFPFVQESLILAGKDPKVKYVDSSLEDILKNTSPAPSTFTWLLSQLRSDDQSSRNSAARTFRDMPSIPKLIASTLAASLKTPNAFAPTVKEYDSSYGEALVESLSQAALNETDTLDAFEYVLRAGIAQPSPQNRKMAGEVLRYLQKAVSLPASLQEAVIRYGETVDAAAAAIDLPRAGAPGLSVLVSRITSAKVAEEDSWLSCKSLRDSPVAAKAQLVPRLLGMMRGDNGPAAACAAAALAGTSEERAGLMELFRQYRLRDVTAVDFLQALIYSPAWDWVSAALREIEGSTANPEPLLYLFDAEVSAKTYGVAALNGALRMHDPRRREAVGAVLEGIGESDEDPEWSMEDLKAALAKCFADPDLRETAVNFIRNWRWHPELRSWAAPALPSQEARMASQLEDPDADKVRDALRYLSEIESPAPSTVDAVRNLLQQVRRRPRIKIQNHTLAGPEADIWDLLSGGCEVVEAWGPAGREAAGPLKDLLFDESTWAQWCAVRTLPRVLPDDPQLPELLAKLAISDEDDELRVEAAEQGLRLGAALGEREFLFDALVLDQRIPLSISKELNGLADELRPWVGRRPKRGPKPPGLPAFPWPPPRWSYLGLFGRDFPRSLLGGDSSTLGDLYQRLYGALKSVDSNFETGLFGVPGGFALLVKPERVNEDGTPFPTKYRWSEGKVPPLSLADYVAQLFTQTVGYFRAMVFVVTDNEQFGSGKEVLPDFATGAADLPDDIAKQTLKDKHVFALVYSWKREPGQAPIMIARELSALTHLQRSGLIGALQQHQ
jgi:HEAT repeat protein